MSNQDTKTQFESTKDRDPKIALAIINDIVAELPQESKTKFRKFVNRAEADFPNVLKCRLGNLTLHELKLYHSVEVIALMSFAAQALITLDEVRMSLPDQSDSLSYELASRASSSDDTAFSLTSDMSDEEIDETLESALAKVRSEKEND